MAQFSDPFEGIVGNAHIKNYLTRMVERNAIANSLLFSGPDGIGKSLFAISFAKLLLCKDDPSGRQQSKIESVTHPDVHVYKPEGKIGMHSIESLRQLSHEVYMAPYEGKWKIFIIHEAERMLIYSANALLKTFEEPAPHSIIILLSSAHETLLPTILSRCQMLHFHTVDDADIATIVQKKCGKSLEESKMIAALAQGSVGEALQIATRGKNSLRLQILEILSKGKMTTYTQLMNIAREMSAVIEQGQKQTEESVREELTSAYPEGLTSIQQHALDKEIDGILSMQLHREVHVVFDAILAWYRDMHLLHLNGNVAYLVHPDFKEQCDQALQRGEILSLETVQAALSQAKLSLERSTPVCNCLENLFLQLNLL